MENPDVELELIYDRKEERKEVLRIHYKVNTREPDLSISSVRMKL